jgi:hypothetical protein
MVFITGVNGMPQINNRYFLVHGGVNVFDLTDAYTNVPVDSSGFGTYAGGGTIQRVYTIGSPYTANELALLKFSQNASVMNITHPNHPPYKLTLVSATNWVLVPATIGATVGPPGNAVVTPSAAGSVSYKYLITAVDDQNQEGTPSNVAITTTAQDLRTVPGSNLIGWTGPPFGAAVFYNVYGSSPSYVGYNFDPTGVGFMGSVQGGGVFIDSNISPDFSQTPPIHDNPFAAVNPQVSSYFQQRLVYANGGGNLVATFWASKTGAPYNFDISNPTQANDAISGELVSLEVNEIKSLIPMPTGLLP